MAGRPSPTAVPPRRLTAGTIGARARLLARLDLGGFLLRVTVSISGAPAHCSPNRSMGPSGGEGAVVAGLGPFALVRRSAGQGHAHNPRVTLPRYAT